MNLSNIHNYGINSKYLTEKKIILTDNDVCNYVIVLLGNKNNIYRFDVIAFGVEYEIIVREEWIIDWRIRYCPKNDSSENDNLNFLALGKISMNGEYIQLHTNNPDTLNGYINIKKITLMNNVDIDNTNNDITDNLTENEYAQIKHECRQHAIKLINKINISDKKRVNYETIFNSKNKKYCMVFENNSNVITFEVLSVGRASNMKDHVDIIIYYKWNKIHVSDVEMSINNNKDEFNIFTSFNIEYIDINTKITKKLDIKDYCVILE